MNSNINAPPAPNWYAVILAAALTLTSSIGHGQTPPTQIQGGGGDLPSTQGKPILPNTNQVNPRDFIEDYSRTILQQQREGRLNEVIGREAEGRQLDRALNTGSGIAVLQGDPSSGKSAVVIQHILDNPDDFVYRVKTEELYRVSKEERTRILKSIIIHLEKLAKSQPQNATILYVDNLPFLNEGNVIDPKPAGAVTEAVAAKRELPMILESNAATIKTLTDASPVFKEQATVIEVKSPIFDAVVNYLQRYRQSIESKTQVSISGSALVEAATQAKRYFNTDPFRKSYELLYRAAQIVNQEVQSGEKEARRIQIELSQIKSKLATINNDKKHGDTSTPGASAELLNKRKAELEKRLEGLAIQPASTEREIAALKRDIADLTELLNETPKGKIFEGAARDDINGKIAAKSTELAKLENEHTYTDPEVAPTNRVTAKHVQIASSQATKLPLSTVSMDINEGAKRIGELNEVIFGQDHLIDRAQKRITSALTIKQLEEEANRANPQSEESVSLRRKPVWSVLIPGRTGTSKTRFAELLAEKVGAPLLKLHMSTYQKGHDSSTLIGARPEYVGHGKEGALTGPVRKSPRIVILLDEVQRATKEILDNILYPILDQGELADSDGNMVYFDEAIILGPTNAGEEFSAMDRNKLIEYLKTQPDLLKERGFTENDLNTMDLITLRAECVAIDLRLRYHWEESLVGRWDDILPTNDLTPEVQELIAHKNAKEFAAKMAKFKIKVVLTEEAMNKLVASFNPAAGGRSIETFFKRYIHDLVVYKLGMGEIKKGDAVIVDVADGSINVIVPSDRQAFDAALGADKRKQALVKGLAKNGEKAAAAEAKQTGKSPLFDEELMVRKAVVETLRPAKR